MIDKAPKRYDISMLRDFLDHLLCELRLARLELANGTDDAHAEQRSLQSTYSRKYQTTSLLEHGTVNNDVTSEVDLQTAQSIFRTMIAEMRDTELKRLEELQGLFDEALRCYRHDESPARVFSAAELLEHGNASDS